MVTKFSCTLTRTTSSLISLLKPPSKISGSATDIESRNHSYIVFLWRVKYRHNLSITFWLLVSPISLLINSLQLHAEVMIIVYNCEYYLNKINVPLFDVQVYNLLPWSPSCEDRVGHTMVWVCNSWYFLLFG